LGDFQNKGPGGSGREKGLARICEKNLRRGPMENLGSLKVCL